MRHGCFSIGRLFHRRRCAFSLVVYGRRGRSCRDTRGSRAVTLGEVSRRPLNFPRLKFRQCSPKMETRDPIPMIHRVAGSFRPQTGSRVQSVSTLARFVQRWGSHPSKEISRGEIRSLRGAARSAKKKRGGRTDVPFLCPNKKGRP